MKPGDPTNRTQLLNQFGFQEGFEVYSIIINLCFIIFWRILQMIGFTKSKLAK